MTVRRFTWSAVVGLAVLMAMLPLYAATPKKTTLAPKIAPQAVSLLRQMSDYLGGLQSFSVHVQTTKDIVLPSDQALSSDMAYDLYVMRPNQLRINMTSAAREAQVFYDGTQVTVFTPKMNLYAVTPAPATIEETLQAAQKRGISMPLAEFIGKESHKRLVANLTSATFVGSSMVDGVMTNQLAFRQKSGVDWQIWVQDSATPLPVRLVIVDRKAKDYPRFTANLSDWNTSPSFDASTFTFVAPEGAQKIDFKALPRQQRNLGRMSPKR